MEKIQPLFTSKKFLKTGFIGVIKDDKVAVSILRDGFNLYIVRMVNAKNGEKVIEKELKTLDEALILANKLMPRKDGKYKMVAKKDYDMKKNKANIFCEVCFEFSDEHNYGEVVSRTEDLFYDACRQVEKEFPGTYLDIDFES